MDIGMKKIRLHFVQKEIIFLFQKGEEEWPLEQIIMLIGRKTISWQGVQEDPLPGKA